MDWRSPVLRWKAAVAAFAIAVAFLDAWSLSRFAIVASPDSHGSLAVRLAGADAGWSRVRAMEARSPLAAAGIAPGDDIRFVRPGDSRRHLAAGEPIGLLVRQSDGARHVTVAAAAETVDTHQTLGTSLMALGSILILAVGTLVGLRGADSVALRALSASLLSQTLHLATILLPGGALQGFLADTAGKLTGTIAYVCFMYFAMAYAQWPLLGERRGRVAFRLYVLAFVAYDAFSMARGAFPAFAEAVPPLHAVAYAENLVSAALSLFVLAYAWHRAHGLRRERLGWIVACLGAIDLAYIGETLAGMSGNRTIFYVSDMAASALVSAGNAGLAYAVLRHRVLDFGFAINRAVVYGTTSLVLAAAFMLASQLLNRVLQFEAREDHRILDMAIGLGLALTARQAVRWVDPRVQRIFFRKWHAAAAKLAAFHVDTIHGRPPEATRAEFLQAVLEFSGAPGAAFYLAAPDGTLRRSEALGGDLAQTLAGDDPLVLALASTKGAVDVQRLDSRRGAALALPMKAHDRLVGAVLVMPKPDDEPFRPDERRQLAQTAQQVGLALELARLRALESKLAEPPPQKPRRKSRAARAR